MGGPAGHDERRYAVFDVSDRYTKSGADADKSKAYFDALHRELETGRLEAMMYDLMNWDLGDWHPRQVYESDGLRKQKDLSMKPLDQWWDAFLEEGTLPLRPPGAPLTFVPTKHLIADAIDRVPYLRNRLGEKEIGIFLERQGCDRLKGRRTASARGWTLLPLREHQERWEQRYGKREWEVREWQSLYDRMTSNKVSPGIDKLLK